MTDDEELDFSSYLVDLDDEQDNNNDNFNNNYYAGPSSFNTASSSTLTTPTSLLGGSFTPSISSSYSSPSTISAGSAAFQPSSSSLATAATTKTTPSSASNNNTSVSRGANKTWSGALMQQRGFPSVSPSPPESTSDSSFKTNTHTTSTSASLSISGTGTAPSSVASSSYQQLSSLEEEAGGGPGASGSSNASSWGTQKTFNPKHSLLSSSINDNGSNASSTSTTEFATPSSALSATRQNATLEATTSSSTSTPTPTAGPTKSSSFSSSSKATMSGHNKSKGSNSGTTNNTSTTPTQININSAISSHPPLDLSFSYDFAHDPSLNTAFSAAQAINSKTPSSSSIVAGPESFNSSNNNKLSSSLASTSSQYSTSLPSSSINGFASRASRGAADRSAIANSSSSSNSNNTSINFPSSISASNSSTSLDLGKPISPSSGPQHISRGHRSRQPSSSSASLSASYNGPSNASSSSNNTLNIGIPTVSTSSSGPLSASAGGSLYSPHWLSMTPTSPSVLSANNNTSTSHNASGGNANNNNNSSSSNTSSGHQQQQFQFASKPYSRPIAPATTATDGNNVSNSGSHAHHHSLGSSLSGGSSLTSSGGAVQRGGSGSNNNGSNATTSNLAKRPSKRKTISNASSNASVNASMQHQLQAAGISPLAPIQTQTQQQQHQQQHQGSVSVSGGISGQMQQYQLPPNATLLPQASTLGPSSSSTASTTASPSIPSNIPGVSQFGFPITGYNYRDPSSSSVTASPISPSMESFAAFSPNYSFAATSNTAASSAATSPSAANQNNYYQSVTSPYPLQQQQQQQQHPHQQQQQHQQQQKPFYNGAGAGQTSAPASKPSSNASTPNDAILSAVTAPSPFDPRNFGSLTFDPLSATDDFASQQWYGQAAAGGGGVMSPPSQAAMEINRAAALAGIGGKWINWANSQADGPDQDASLISNVLHDSPEVANAPTPSVPHTSNSGSNHSGGGGGSSGSKATSPAANMFDPFPQRESSVVTSPFGDIDGERPEDLAARDPLATHLWRLYAKAKAGLPNGARMENITWRMMSLKLNKQKAIAEAAGSPPALQQQGQGQEQTVASLPTTSKAAPQETEEAERGRRGRSSGPSSASPAADGADFEEMDWRKHSRSRSRVPQAMTGGMDWRGNSRSRSRAPNMRISMPSGPSGFHLPTYADIVETMASVSRAPQDVATGTNAATTTQQQASDSYNTSAPATSGHISQSDMQSFEQTLKQLMQDGEAQRSAGQNISASHVNQAAQTGDKNTTSVPYSYVPPAPLPLSPSQWINSPQSVQDGATPASQTLAMPESSKAANNNVLDQQLQQNQHQQTAAGSTQSQTMAVPRSGAQEIDANADSQKSISASVEAYLSSLEHATSVIDLPPHRHVGSIPGLFNEQELKANQHADYGFIPKLVRKTSFDASYPAQLAHEQQKSKSQKRRQPAQQDQQAFAAPASLTTNADQGNTQNWSDANNLFLMDNINSYLQSSAQSVPSTPSALSASFPINFFPQMQSGYPTPFSPYAGESPEANAQASAHAQTHVQTAAAEAFRRLQNAQALQAANAMAHQHMMQQQHSQTQGQTPSFSTPYLDPSFAGSPGTVPPEVFAAAMAAVQYQPAGMHVNPSQVSGLPYPPNAYPGFVDAASTWPASPQVNQTSPVSHYPSPDDIAAAEEDRLRSTVSSRASSMSNIPSLLSQSYTADHSLDDLDTSAIKKTHSRQNSNVSASTPQANADSSGSPTICVNCKTTNTPLWRRDEHGQPLCNACQLFRKLHGSDRPVSLHNSVVKKRNRTRNNKEAPKKSTSRSQRGGPTQKLSDEGTVIEAQ